MPEVAIREELNSGPEIDLGNRTPEQRDAIIREGKVIVPAGAGSGKTSTLVDKCLYWLITKKAHLDELLVVTFTEAATGEMRRRLREGLERHAVIHPTYGPVQEHLDLFDTAHIRTLHGFCYFLVKENFHELGLDPRVAVMQTERETWVQKEAMDQLMTACYEGADEFSLQVQAMLRESFSSEEEKLRKVVERLHRFSMTQPSAEEWIEKQIDIFEKPLPETWRKEMEEGYPVFLKRWYSKLKQNGAGIPFPADLPMADLATQLKDAWKKSDSFKKQVSFWESVQKAGVIEEDWNHCRKTALTLLRLTQEFSKLLWKVKVECGQVGFDDLQQLAIQLMQNSEEARLTWRNRFKLVVVDEYQDITPAQDKLIRELCSPEATLFLVGDVKQSIYGFRMATPELFNGYVNSKEFEGISLNANFRSHETIIDFVNSIFNVLMTEGTSQVDYKGKARLTFGDKERRRDWTREHDASTRVEIHFIDEEGDEDEVTLEKIEQEAWIIGNRLKQLHETEKIEWHDMAVLLRAMKGKFEEFARIFHQMGIPVAGNAETFEHSAEFLDLQALLSLVDNFRQDIPLAAVMRSPFGQFTAAELAIIRSETSEQRYFWESVTSFAKEKGELQLRVKTFLDNYEQWRGLQKRLGIHELLEVILASSGYWTWLEAQARSHTRKEFAQKFIKMAAEFEIQDGRGLNCFLRFLKAQEELEIESKPPKSANIVHGAVQIMTVHGSKGLEFKVVAMANIAKKFNNMDGREEFIISEKHGIAGLVHCEDKRYPSLAHQLAVQESKEKNAKEELRLLYVALTRAKERLILCGNCPVKTLEDPKINREALNDSVIVLETESYLKWLLPILKEQGMTKELSGQAANFSWRFYAPAEAKIEAREESAVEATAQDYERVMKGLTWRYEHVAATELSAKRSASRLISNDDDEVELAEKEFEIPNFQFRKSGGAAEIGSATHLFIESIDLKNCGEGGLRKQIEKLVAEGVLPEDMAEEIDISAISRFWSGQVGKEILSNGDDIRREFAFTFRLSPAEFLELVPEEADKVEKLHEEEFIIMQGVVDLAVVKTEEIWILDFKTDREPDEASTRKHARQLAAYGKAMEAIYGRSVTRRWVHYLATGETVGV